MPSLCHTITPLPSPYNCYWIKAQIYWFPRSCHNRDIIIHFEVYLPPPLALVAQIHLQHHSRASERATGTRSSCELLWKNGHYNMGLPDLVWAGPQDELGIPFSGASSLVSVSWPLGELLLGKLGLYLHHWHKMISLPVPRTTIQWCHVVHFQCQEVPGNPSRA